MMADLDNNEKTFKKYRNLSYPKVFLSCHACIKIATL